MIIQDLRVGNWYMSVKWKQPVQCELTDFYEIYSRSDGAYDDPPISEIFEPIPLTEEWLIKFGFKRVEMMFEKITTLYWRKDRLKLYRVHTSAVSEDWFYEVWFADDHDNEAVIRLRLDLVHQLQNLYYALTGEELKINL